MCAPQKGYEMRQLEWLELEELTMRISPGECGKILSLFRDAVEARQPEVCTFWYFCKLKFIKVKEACQSALPPISQAVTLQADTKKRRRN